MVQPGVSALGKKKSTTGLPWKSFNDTFLPFSSGKVNSGALSLTCMGISPFSSKLYRSTGLAVIWVAAAFATAQDLPPQFTRKPAVSKGPRAVGLLMLPSKGKPRLIPIAIMVDGRFYDAGVYKADPVPMALDPGTVYEAERTGDSVGLFTINQVLQQKNNWLAEGTYRANGEVVASKEHKAETKPREETDEGPPKLRRPGSEPSKPANAPAPTQPAPPPKPSSSASTTTPAAAQSGSAPSAPEETPEDPNRPRLRRGVPEKSARAKAEPEPAIPDKTAKITSATTASPSQGSKAAPTAAGASQTIVAVSDAGGPDPRPFTYDMKPEEEQAFRTKMLALAAKKLSKKSKDFEQPGAKPAVSKSRTRGAAVRPPEPAFEDVQLHVFDVSSSNEPILVLTATAHPATLPKSSDARMADYYITLVAHSDIYNELKTLLSVITDSQHLDVEPRMQLIDAVDADGDGRGELLFRDTSDAGSYYAIYRVGSDRLWPLYEGSPQ